MFLRIQHDDDSSLVEVLDLPQLFDPFEPMVLGRLHAGEELQEPQACSKAELRFPSGEALPSCWLRPAQQEPARDSTANHLVNNEHHRTDEAEAAAVV